MREGILFVVSGPSGAGKGTLIKTLLEQYSKLKINLSISTTTRQPRTGETSGKNYWFITKEAFKTMIHHDELLEWAEVYGNFYGTPIKILLECIKKGEDFILEIDIHGALQVRAKFPHAVLIFVAPPSFEELIMRINKRGTDGSK